MPHDVIDVPGDHFSMVEAHARQTARVIHGWLGERCLQVKAETGVQFVSAYGGELHGALGRCAGDPAGVDHGGEEVCAEASGEVVALL